MIHLLYIAILTEALIIVLLLFETPLRNLVIAGIDKIKRGNGPIVVKTVCGTILIVLSSSIYSIIELTGGGGGGDGDGDGHDHDHGDLNPTQLLLFAQNLLQSSLMGFILFLALIVDRLHYYIKELRVSRKTVETIKKTEDIRTKEMQVETFNNKIRQMESELQDKIKEAKSYEATVEALRKQSEGLVHEYDRLLAENQELRKQLQIVDRRVSRSASKKDL